MGSEGCEFWAVVMDNPVTATFRTTTGDSGFGFLVGSAAGVPATVNVYRQSSGVETLLKTMQTGAGGFVAINVPWQSIDMAGTFTGASGILPVSYRLVSDVPVVAYQFNTLTLSSNTSGFACTSDSDCFLYPDTVCAAPEGQTATYCIEPAYTQDSSLLIPVHALGLSYVVTAVESADIVADAGVPPSSATTAQSGELTVLATQDGTTVTVRSSAATVAGTGISALIKGQTSTFTLNRYQALQLTGAHAGTYAQCVVNPFDTAVPPTTVMCREDNDLSGTVVTSDKPVAVFGGSPCTLMPVSAAACDHVEEQLTPLATWGSSYVLPRTAPVRLTSGALASSANAAPDFWKVTAACPASTCPNGTALTFSSPPSAGDVLPGGGCTGTALAANGCHLAGGTSVTFSAKQSLLLSADHPVQVAQFLAGQGATLGTDVPAQGDPTMMLVPAVEQWASAVEVVVPGFQDNYLAVAVDSSVTSSITLDGVSTSTSSLATVAGNYRAGNLTVGPGLHRLQAFGSAPALGVLTYGFSSYVSYGAPAPTRYQVTNAIVP